MLFLIERRAAFCPCLPVNLPGQAGSKLTSCLAMLGVFILATALLTSPSHCSLMSSGAKTDVTTSHVVIPQFAVEPTNVRIVDGVSAPRSALFTCLLAQPTAASTGENHDNFSNSNPPLIAGNGAFLSWFYNAKQIDLITDKIRIPLANGSLYVSTAAAEQPAPNSPLADVPLPTSKGYNCRASAVVNFNRKSYNATIVSRVAHVVKQPPLPLPTGSATVRPQRLQVRLADVVVLVCGGGSAFSSSNNSNTLIMGDGTVADQFVWFRDDVPFPDESANSRWAGNNPSVTFTDNGRIVEFSEISADDLGEYACSRAAIAVDQRRNSLISRFIIAQNNNQFESAEHGLRFLLRPSDKQTVTKATAASSSVTLFCSAADTGSKSAGAVVTTTWLKDGVTIALSSNEVLPTASSPSSDLSLNRYQKVGRGSLLISNIHSDDSGLYTCRSSLTIGETTAFADANVLVSVVVAPKPSSSSTRTKTVITQIGGSVEISCDIENAMNFFWFHNGNYLAPTNADEQQPTLSASNREYFYEYGQLANNNGRPLNLWALTDSDSGVYQCFGVSPAGLASTATFLVVEQSAPSLVSNSSEKYEFVSPAATVLRSDLEADKAKQPLNVRATSRSATTIRLAWEPPILTAGVIISGYVVLLKPATLTKGEASADGASRLRRLFATNPELLIDRLAPGRKYEITVAVAFKMSGQAMLTVGAMSPSVVVSTERMLLAPTSLPAEDGKATTISNHADDYADYSSYSSLFPQPRNLKAELRGPTTVSLTWTSPAIVPSEDGQIRSSASTRLLQSVNRYRLFYRGGTPGVRNSQQDAYVDLPGHQTTHVFTSLQPNTAYTFFVRAGMSGNGGENSEAAQLILGPASRDVTIWTPSAAPTGSPQKVEAVTTSPSTIAVRWQPPLTNLQNGLITGYQVVYQPKSRSSATQSPSTQQSTGRTAITDGITTMITLKDGVAPSTDYEIRVAAINVNGTGPFSESVFANTPEQQLTESATPGAPFAFTARAPSPSQIVLSWQPPSSSSSVLVRGYYISFGVGEPYRNQVMVDSTKTEHILTNLRPSSEYIISLRSYNNYGYGPEVFQAVRTPQLPASGGIFPLSSSSEVAADNAPSFDVKLPNQQQQSSARQPAAPLAVPLGVKAFTLSDSAMLVSWTDPNEHSYRTNNHNQRGGGNKEHHVTYTVRYGTIASLTVGQENSKNGNSLLPIGSSPIRWRFVNSTLPSVRVHSLEPYQEYEFAVRIVRVDADHQSRQQISDWSMSASNRTLDAPPSDAPRDVKVTEVTSTSSSSPARGASVRVSWQSPLKPNGVITSYVVFYSAHSANRAERDWQVIGVAGDRFSVLIRRLQPDASYYFKVQAKNGRGYGPVSSPPVHIRTPQYKPVVVGADDDRLNAMTESRPLSNNNNNNNRLLPTTQQQQQPESSQVDLTGGTESNHHNNVGDDSWPFDPSFFENHVIPRNGFNGASSTAVPLFVTSPKLVIRNGADGISQDDLDVVGQMTNASANTLWLAVSAAIGALVVCIVASISVFVCRKITPSRSTSKLMPKSESMGPGRMITNNNGKMPPPENGLPTAANADIWAMRDHLELRQQLLSSAELQSTVGVGGGGMSEDNLMQNERGSGSSARHRPLQSVQDPQGTASIRQHLYHIDPYESETMIIGDVGDHARQTTSSIVCSPTGQPTMSYRQQATTSNCRLFNSRTSTATLSCQESGYPLISNNHHTYCLQNGTSTQSNNGADEFVVDVNAAAMSTARLGSVMSYHHIQHRGSPASMIGGMVNINDHPHMLPQHRQQQSTHMLLSHQTLPRLSIATMPSPGPASMHRYEPLLTTTSNGPFLCPPSAQTPDSGCDLDHNMHHQMQQQQRQRTSLSSSSYGGGSVSSSTTNNLAPFACSSSICASRQPPPGMVSNNPNGDAANSPSVASNGLSGSISGERPRLSSFQPLQTTNGTPPALGTANKTSFLHLSRVLPPTPGQARSSTGSSSATMSSACASQQPDRTSSATLSSSSPINNGGGNQNSVGGVVPETVTSCSVGVIHLPPAPPELQSTTATDEELAADDNQLRCLDGLIKDLKLNVATSSSVTLTGNNGVCPSKMMGAVSAQ